MNDCFLISGRCLLVRMSECIGFCRMHNTVGMFWRRVDREQLHSFIASVREIVFRSGWYRKHIAWGDVMCFASHDGLSRAFDKNQHLVNTCVDFPPNVFTRKNTHQDHLGVFVCEQDLPKVIVFQSELLNILVLHEIESPFSQ